MSVFIISPCCSITAVRSFVACVFKKQKYLPWFFFPEFWNLLCIKISKHQTVQLKKKIYLGSERAVPLDWACAFIYDQHQQGGLWEKKFWKFSSFFHCTCIFCLSLLDPKLSLALSLALPPCVSCPPTWAVLPLWQLSGISITEIQTARSTVLPLDRFLPIPGGFFHISHLIHCSPEEHHPLLLLRQKKKKKRNQY